MLAKVLHFLFIAFEVLAIFNLLIIVHELGHFLAARWRGLYIDEFGIWFGKPIWRKRINNVWYSLGSIPAGGFVKLPQLAPMDAIEGESDIPREALQPISPLDKIIVALAGPVFSILLAFAMATAVWIVGKPQNEIDSTTIGYVAKGGPADQAGLKPGDEVISVDGKNVTHFVSGTNSVKWAIIRSEGEKIAFRIKRDGNIQTIESGWVKPAQAGWHRPALREVQIGPRIKPGVGFVEPKSPADQAGVKIGDLITAINGQPVAELEQIEPFVAANAGGSLALTVLRGKENVALTMALPALKPGEEKSGFDLGIGWGRTTLSHPSPWQQVSESATTIFRMVGALASPKSDVKASHFSGPVGIMKLYYTVFEAEDAWRLALGLSVLINVNLGLLNMLPFPVLDGGHIMLAIIESVRRKPVSVRVLEIVQTGCAVALIGFMLYVTFFDVGDFFGRKPKDAPKTEEKAPPAKPDPAPPEVQK
jgi:regulator of sigma E protease